MAATPRCARLTLLALALAAAPLAAQQARFSPQAVDSLRAQEPARVATAARHLESLRPELGLDARHGFQFTRVLTDDFGQAHARFAQTFQGVRVWDGEIITHQDAEGTFAPHTLALRNAIQINTTPGLAEGEALAVAHRVLAPKGDYTAKPTAELVIYPVTTTVARRPRDRHELPVTEAVLRYHLAYHVHTQLENGTEETRHTDFIIDANTGAVLKTWNSLRTTDAVGTANTQYSGVRSIHTNLNGASYELRDIFRPMNISTYNLNHGTGSGTGTLYTDADNTWGDGANYVEGSSTTAANGQTAGTDAHYGIEVTYDFFKNVMNRNGIDNANRATYSRVHYSNSYDNAFWDDTCFCMTYGDGSSFTTLTSLDVAGHEMSHGVCSNSANLTYSGEPGGLNESNSDILGNMVELYSNSGNTLPSSVANTNNCWLVGEQLASTPLRYMTKPSKDGGSRDAWSSTLGSLDVHYSSGPNNRMFFFLSQGASATAGDYYSSYTPSGFTGIGPAKAAQIWYRALTVYLTSSSNYAAARTACINSAKDLYGAGGAEEAAVWNAYAAINVGSVWNNGDTTAPTCSASESGSTGTITLSATASDNVAVTKVEFYIDGSLVGTDTTSPYSMTFNSATLADGSHTLVAKAYDAAGNIGSSTSVPFSTSNGTSGYQNEVESNNTRGSANVVATSGTTVKGYISTSSDTDYFKVTVPAGHTFQAILTPPATSDFDLYLYNSNGTQVASSILGTGSVDTASVTNTSSAAKVYYARVRYYSGASTVNPYTLKLTF